MPLQPYKDRPTEAFRSQAWLELCAGQVNLALLCGSRSGGLIGIDFDDEERGLEFDAANPHLADTLRIVGARGWKIILQMRGDFPPSERTPQCEWRSDGNLCHVAGLHPSGVMYSRPVDRPPLEVAFDEIVWPPGWTVPGVTRALQAAAADLEARYGPPYWVNDKGAPIQLNEGYWAGLYLAEQLTIWCPEEGQFYRYDGSTGVWRVDDPPVMKRRLREMLLAQSRAMNLPWLARQTSSRTLGALLTQVQNESSRPGVFGPEAKRDTFVHAANCMLCWRADGWVAEPFAPDFYSRNASPMRWDPEATCPRFLRDLLHRCLPEDDAIVLQKLAGMFLLGRNILQRILIIDGAAGTGKSQLVDVIVGMVGLGNTCNVRTDLLDERFEIAQFIGKTLLIGPDVSSNFLLEEGAGRLKSIVGGDVLAAEIKGLRGAVQVHGVFNVLITSNARLRMRLQGDVEAWRRRIVILRSEAAKPERAIAEFGRVLLREEGPGILNWALQGVRMLFEDIADHGARLQLTAEQQKRIDRALSESDSLRLFLIDGVRWDSSADVTTEEVLSAYSEWCNAEDIAPMPDRVAQNQLPTLMLELFQTAKSSSVERDGKSRKGYRNVTLSFRWRRRELSTEAMHDEASTYN